jgi:hypothetical protein
MFTFFGPGEVGFFPPLPPRPFTPAGVKGSLNSQFGFLGLDRGLSSGVCDARLDAYMGERGIRNQGKGLGAAAALLAKQKKVTRPAGRNLNPTYPENQY